MLVYTDHAGHTILMLATRRKKIEFITHKHGHRTIARMSIESFNKTYKQLDKSPADLARLWLKSPIKATDRVREVLQMATKEQKAPKKETKFPFIPADSMFKALENQRKHGESVRTKVYACLAEKKSATAKEIAEELELDVKVVLGNLRNLVHDNKAAVI